MNPLITGYTIKQANPPPSDDREKVITARKPSTSYFLLDSADRNQNASLQLPALTDANAWNDFRLQRPQPLMGAFARRITVSEINFPWFIPNISRLNNTIILRDETLGLNYTISVPSGFYTPALLVSTMNTLFANATAPNPPPTMSYDSIAMRYTFNGSLGGNVYSLNLSATVQPSFSDFVNSPSLFKTLGFAYIENGTNIAPGDGMQGLPTLTQYTSFVDICSDKLMTYTDVLDGNSYKGGKDRVVCRLFASDEVSIPMSLNSGNPITCQPFVIHRQFKNPKEIQWSPDSTVDWLDIQVFDEYGNLVPLPRFIRNLSTGLAREGAYPDFQITCAASEN